MEERSNGPNLISIQKLLSNRLLLLDRPRCGPAGQREVPSRGSCAITAFGMPLTRMRLMSLGYRDADIHKMVSSNAARVLGIENLIAAAAG